MNKNVERGVRSRHDEERKGEKSNQTKSKSEPQDKKSENYVLPMKNNNKNIFTLTWVIWYWIIYLSSVFFLFSFFGRGGSNSHQGPQNTVLWRYGNYLLYSRLKWKWIKGQIGVVLNNIVHERLTLFPLRSSKGGWTGAIIRKISLTIRITFLLHPLAQFTLTNARWTNWCNKQNRPTRSSTSYTTEV